MAFEELTGHDAEHDGENHGGKKMNDLEGQAGEQDQADIVQTPAEHHRSAGQRPETAVIGPSELARRGRLIGDYGSQQSERISQERNLARRRSPTTRLCLCPVRRRRSKVAAWAAHANVPIWSRVSRGVSSSRALVDRARRPSNTGVALPTVPRTARSTSSIVAPNAFTPRPLLEKQPIQRLEGSRRPRCATVVFDDPVEANRCDLGYAR